MLLEKNIALCSGCGACSCVCPKQCILMQKNSEGFLYPQIDHATCISCRICEKACPVLNHPAVSDQTESFAVMNNDDQVREKSSSGGVFSLLAEYVLDLGGKVYGAAYNEEFAVEHICIDSKEQIGRLRGAKYAQSYAFRHFPVIKEELEQGQYVLFVGTPCQAAALRSYLGKEYETLILVDMICHGVPSPMVWKKYLDERVKLDAPGSSIEHINLRSKSSGWSRYSYSVEVGYTNGNTYCVKQGEDLYLKGFVQNLYLRPSCSECSFKGYQRCSDFTLADCWGIWDISPEMDDNKGTSLLMIHSDKGKKIWNSLSEKYKAKELSEEEAIRQNGSAICSSSPHAGRDSFFHEMVENDNVIGLIRSHLYPEKKSGLKRFLSRIIRK